VNDLQLQSRLAELADDLAPDADPYAQVSGARSLHRRRRRTRIAVAGAVAAVALVAVGVPTVVGTLSAPDRSDVAGPAVPSSPTPVPPHEAEPTSVDADFTALESRSARLREAMADRPQFGLRVKEDRRRCPFVSPDKRLGPALGVILEPVAEPAVGDPLCAWSDAGRTVWVSAQFLPGAEPGTLENGALPDEISFRQDDTGEAPASAQAGCYGSTVYSPGAQVVSLDVCSLDEAVAILAIEDAGGAGMWRLVAAVPDREGDATDELLAVADVLDTLY